MASISIPDSIRAQAADRAAKAGFANVDDFVVALVNAEAAGAPDGLSISDDDALRAIVDNRLDGPWVDADAADFARIRGKFRAGLDQSDGSAEAQR